jgi:hypothetical protein
MTKKVIESYTVFANQWTEEFLTIYDDHTVVSTVLDRSGGSNYETTWHWEHFLNLHLHNEDNGYKEAVKKILELMKSLN